MVWWLLWTVACQPTNTNASQSECLACPYHASAALQQSAACCVCSGLTLALLVSVVFLLLLRYLAIVLVWILMVGLLVVGGYGKSVSYSPAAWPGLDYVDHM